MNLRVAVSSALLVLSACQSAEQLDLTRPAPPGVVEGYALKLTVEPGEPLPVAVNVKAAGPVRWKAFRVGRHDTSGKQWLAEGGPVNAAPQKACDLDEGTGLVSCGWSPTLHVPTAGLKPGLHVLHLSNAAGQQSLVPFTVRDRQARPRVVVVVPIATWAAYNSWGGQSLYLDEDDATGGAHSFAVSLDKPFATGNGAGDLMRFDRPLAEWLEAQGLDVGYVTSDDVDRDPDAFTGAKVIVLSGHDEYWSLATRDRIEAAVARGISLISLGANTGYWQIRWEAAADGRDRRHIVCYKERAADLDPVGPSDPTLTGRFRDLAVPRPESALLGVAYNDGWNYFAHPLVVEDAGHWALEGTGLRKGDVIAHAHGYEIDQTDEHSPAGTAVLARSPTLSFFGLPRRAEMALHHKGAALVFAAGGTDFVKTLSQQGSVDSRSGRIVANVLYRALGEEKPRVLPDFAAQPRPQPVGPFARSVQTIASNLGAPVALVELPGGDLVVSDSAGARLLRVAHATGAATELTARLGPVLGLAADDAGNVYASEVEAGLIHRIAPDGTEAVIAGAGWGGADGPGAQAQFRNPTGLALHGGALYVADMSGGTVRRIALGDPAFPVQTIAKGLRAPSALAFRPDGTLVVAETLGHRLVELSPDGEFLRVLAGDGAEGFKDAECAHAHLLAHLGLAVLPDGSVALSDPASYRVRVATDSVVHTLAGSGRAGGRSGPGEHSDLVVPAGLALARDGRLLVAESGAGRIRAISR